MLPAIWSGFQLIGADPRSTRHGAANAVILGSILLVVTTMINAVGVRMMAIVNSIGVTCEIVGVVAARRPAVHPRRARPGVVLQHRRGSDAGTGYFVPFLISALMAAYVMVGFDSAGELSEETGTPGAPRRARSCGRWSSPASAARCCSSAALMAAPSA